MRFPLLTRVIAPALVAGAVALALYARPRTYQTFLPPVSPAEGYAANPNELPGTGRIVGRVIWPGPLPEVLGIEGNVGRADGSGKWEAVPNPAAPAIDPKTRGVADVVVYLKSAPDAGRKPWPYSSLRVEMGGDDMHLLQGGERRKVGFVPVGGSVEMASRDTGYRMLRARGAAFFTLPFPKAETRTRTFGHAGPVEFTSATGQFWSATTVFVCEHPYFTLTDAEGRFELTGLRPGTYEVEAWLKNWTITSRERDPESGRIVRLNFAEPVRRSIQMKAVEGDAEPVTWRLP